MTTIEIILTIIVILLFIIGTMFRINLKKHKTAQKKTTENFRNFNQ